jgi:hypothetical protein
MNARSLWLLSVLTTVVACSDSSAGPDDTGNGNTDGRLQVVSAVASVSSVDIVVDGQTRLSNVPYGVPSSPIALSLGQHSVKVVPAGTAPSAGGTVVTLRAGDTTRVVVTGTPTAMTPVALGDTGAAPVAGKGKLRVSHLAANAPAVDVYRTQPDFPSFVKFMEPFPFNATTPFIMSDPGNWTIRVTVRGTNQVLAETSVRVDALWIRTVLLLDAPNGGIKITPLGEQ